MPPLIPILFGALFSLLSSYSLGVFLLRRTPAPFEIALAVGVAAQSLVILFLLLLHLAFWPAFLAIGICEIALLARFHRAPLTEPSKHPLGRSAWIAAAVIFTAYGLLYLVNALAPEIYADGITYHLGLPYEYVRLGRFPHRVGFYEILPEGMEMLYTMAFAFGRHSAAKLIEFALFAATAPLLFRISRRLGAGDMAALTAAVFYGCAPVAGLTASSSYIDAAGVFFALAAFYVLLVWREIADRHYLFFAGVLAGFCYALKMPGIAVVIAAVLFVIWTRRNPAWLLAGASLMIVPWVLRAAAMAGNPLAPFYNRLFPNPYFHVFGEKIWSMTMRSLGPVTTARLPWELAFGDRLTGTFGPLLLALPLALLALRKRSGRLCWAAAILLAIPWFSNRGARFLMPAVAFAALALGIALPRAAAWIAILIQAAICWPQALDAWQPGYQFRLHEFPWRAALRIEPEPDYLRRHIDEYDVARMIERATPPGSRTLALLSVANAYLARDVRVEWQSAEGERLLDTVQTPIEPGPIFDWQASWPPEPLRALRFRLPVSAADEWSEWDIREVQLYSGAERLPADSRWTTRAWPNPWEAPLALDGNLTTRWRTWEPMRAGMFFEIDFDAPRTLTSAALVSHTPAYHVPLEIYGQTPGGKWHLLSNQPSAVVRAPEDVRRDVARGLSAAGYQYLLTPTGKEGHGPFGDAVTPDPAAWGFEIAGRSGRCVLFRIAR